MNPSRLQAKPAWAWQGITSCSSLPSRAEAPAEPSTCSGMAPWLNWHWLLQPLYASVTAPIPGELELVKELPAPCRVFVWEAIEGTFDVHFTHLWKKSFFLQLLKCFLEMHSLILRIFFCLLKRHSQSVNAKYQLQNSSMSLPSFAGNFPLLKQDFQFMSLSPSLSHILIYASSVLWKVLLNCPANHLNSCYLEWFWY